MFGVGFLIHYNIFVVQPKGMKTIRPRFTFVAVLISIFCFTYSAKGYSQSAYGPVADSLMNLIKNDQPDTLKVIHLTDLGWNIMFQNPDSAIDICNQALELGIRNLKEVPTGKADLRRATENGISIAYNHLGFIHYLKSEYKTALEYHFKSLEIRERYQYKKGLMASYNNIGVVYRDQGDYPRALNYLFKALGYAKELDNKNAEATILNNVGNIYQSEKDDNNALKAYTKGLIISDQAENKNLSGNLLLNMGTSYFNLTNYKMALECYFKALKINQEIDNQFATASTMIVIANVYNVTEDNTEASEWYIKALEINKQLDNKNGISVCLGGIGINYFHQKKYREAETNLLAAIKISEELGAIDLILNQAEGLSELYSKTNRYDLAYKYHVQYADAKDSLFNDEKSKEIGKLEAKHEIELEERERIQKAELEMKIKTEEKERKNLLQYSGITVLLLIVSIIIVFLGRIKVKPTIASSVIFFAFLLFFEFMLVLLDPSIDRWSGGEPVYKLLFNVALAAFIFPIHAFFERLLRKRLIKQAQSK